MRLDHTKINCSGQIRVFADAKQQGQAVSICSACRVRAQCLTLALNNIEHDNGNPIAPAYVQGGALPREQIDLWNYRLLGGDVPDSALELRELLDALA